MHIANLHERWYKQDVSLSEVSAKYKREDFKKLSWEEYEKTIDELYDKVKAYIDSAHITIDAVVPLLRGGAFPGMMLAYRLSILRILPVQYKYFFVNNEAKLQKIYGLTKTQTVLPQNPTFLLVENCHCFGLTAQTAAKDIKEEFPTCKIIYAADHMDYSYQRNAHADEIFYGGLINATKELTDEQAKKKEIIWETFYYPWESLEEEFMTTQGKQFPFQDADEILKTSEEKVSIPLE